MSVTDHGGARPATGEPPPPAVRVWTAEQRRAIERRDGDLLLDAGAGSGKTSVLVERFAMGVLEDGVDVARMLTITFTEKAAAELRDRIRARLRALGAVGPARQTETAFISTIHGFCARVLRAHALAAGLDPGFVVLDRSQTEPLVAAAFDDALMELAREADGMVDLIAAYGALPLRAAIVGVYGQLRSAGATVPRLPAAEIDDDPDAAARLARSASALAAELGSVTAPGVKVIEALERLDRSLELAAAGDVWPAALYAVRVPRNGGAFGTDACAAYADALERFRVSSAARAAGPVRDLLDALLGAFGERYRQRKRAAAGLDFEDLELICRDLLAGDDDVRERYASRFDRIMVDELQDTNRVQLALIESIARDNLFTVGDAQQSIYGFRHAEVELFTRRGERLAAAGARETLRTNFRSRPAILEAINLAFAGQLGERFTPLRPGRAESGRAPAVELVLVDKGADWDQEGVASPWRVAEARALAAHVARLVAEGWTPGDVVVLMRATTDMRAYERALESHGLPTYVIGGRGYWSHPQVVDLVSYLRALANPRDEEALYAVLASPLVGASLDALILVGAGARRSGRDPWQVLREPGDDLDGLASGDRSRLGGFADWFGPQRLRAMRASAEELIDAALEQTGYDVTMLALPGGRRRLANVRKLMRLAREYEQAHGADLRGFLSLVAARESGRGVGGADPHESEAPVEGEGLDAIRLMTIHRAKGLEFNVVCVADLGRSVRPPAELLRVGADGRLGVRLIRAGVPGREPALHYQAIGEQRRLAEEEEERRLFYVAMTRARERLVLSGAAKFDGWTAGTGRTGGGPVAWVAPAFVPELGTVLDRGGGEVTRDGVRLLVHVGRPGDPGGPAQAPPRGTTAAAQDGGGAVVPAKAADADPAPAPPVATLSYSSLGEHARCGYRFYAERVLGLPRSADGRAAATARGVRSAADRGTLLHALLERLDFRRPLVPGADAVAAAAACAGLTPAPGPGEADELAGVVRRFADSDLCARLGRAFDVRREERFAFALPAGALVVGALDVLAAERGGGALIVDYKSDRLDGAKPGLIVEREYAGQRLIYALAALRTGVARVEVIHCFLERPGAPVVAAYAQDRRPDLEARVRDLSAGVLERRFDVTAAPYREVCAGCPAEGGLCSWPLELTRREAPDRLF